MPEFNDTLAEQLSLTFTEPLSPQQEQLLQQLNHLWDLLGKKLNRESPENEAEEEQDINEILEAIEAWDAHYNDKSKKEGDEFSKTLYEAFHQQFERVKKGCNDRKTHLLHTKDLAEIEKEQRRIANGLYQHQFYEFTYDLWKHRSPEWTDWHLTQLPSQNMDVTIESEANGEADTPFQICPILDKPGLVCTAAIPHETEDDTLEIQLNFFGTTDFASQKVDMEEGGPGQLTIKEHERELIRRVAKLVEEVSKQHPEKQIRLRVSGHSLGGSLAKAFTHSLQKAIALQEHEPEAVLQTIRQNIAATQEQVSSAHPVTPEELAKELEQLRQDLTDEQHQYQDAAALKKVTGITMYSLGGPGVSKRVDQNATLMTYYHPEHFIRVYNHNHSIDLIPKFGEREFLSGQDGLPPRVATHKTFTLKSALSQEEIDESFTLPFPGCTKAVMAAHNQRIFNLTKNDREAPHEITNTCETLSVLNKKQFHAVIKACFKFLFKVLNAIERIAKLIYEDHDLPEIVKTHQFADLSDPQFTTKVTSRIRPRSSSEKVGFSSEFKRQLATLCDHSPEIEEEIEDPEPGVGLLPKH